MSKCLKRVYWAGIAVSAIVPGLQGYYGAKQFTCFWLHTETQSVIVMSIAATLGVQSIYIATGLLMIICCGIIIKQVAASLPSG
jgi:hypothetical protein